MGILEELRESIINGNPEKAKDLTRKALEQEVGVGRVLKESLIAGIHEVGERFGRNEIFLPELLVAGMAMRGAVEILKPLLIKSGAGSAGRAVIATVRGDLHDIGKNIVAMMLEGGGFEVTDLGTDVPATKIVEKAREKQAHLVCLSSLLTTTMPAMKEVVGEIKKQGLKGSVKVLIGGAPVTQKHANEIGADGYAPDAPSAVKKANELMAGFH